MNMSKKSRIPKEETWDNLHGERCDFFLHTESLRRPHNWAKECWNMDQYVQKMLIFFLRRSHTFYKHYMSQSYMHLNLIICESPVSWPWLLDKHLYSSFELNILHLAVAPARLTTTPGGLIFTGHTSVLQKRTWHLTEATNLVTTSLKSSLSRK